MLKKILGFDISSTTIGYCVLTIDETTKDIKFVSVDYLKPTKKGTLIERLADTRDKIKKIIEDIKPDHISIEDIIMFIRGKSTANTIVTLALFNRMIGLLAYDYLKKMPSLLGVLAIRHGLKLTPDFPDKEEMPEIVAKHLGMKFPYQYNKNKKIKVESYDMADGIAVALFYAFILTGKSDFKDMSAFKKVRVKKTKKPKRTRKVRTKRKK